MYVRETRQKRADGTILTHIQLAESVWNPVRMRSVTKVIAGFGRADDPETLTKLKRLAKSIFRRTEPEALGAEAGWKLRDAWPYGPTFVLDQLWGKLGLRNVSRHIGRKPQRKGARARRAPRQRRVGVRLCALGRTRGPPPVAPAGFIDVRRGSVGGGVVMSRGKRSA